MHNRPFPENPLRAAKPFQRIHSDLREYPVLSYSKYKYFISFLDDCTSCAWIILLKKKSDALDATNEFLTMIHTQYGIKVQEWFSDDGGEYISKKYTDLLKSRGIIMFRSVPYQKQMNGRAERFNRTIDEKAEALRFQACLPPSWWEFCVLHAHYLYNRTPVVRLKWNTPIDVATDKTPDLSKLKIFGCGAYVFLPKEVRKNKLSPKSELMTFLGYRFGHEANMIFMRAPNNVLFYGTTALFDETLFPKCPTTKIPPVTQIRNKKKKSGETQPPVVIEYGSDSSDDYDDHLPYPFQSENVQPRPKLGPGQPPLPLTGQRRLPPPYVPPPPPPALPPRPPSWRQGPPSSVAGPSGTQDEATPADGPRRSHRERRFPFREGNVYSPGTQSDKDRRKKFGKQNIAPESVSELPMAVSSDTDAISMETVNSTTEGESHWINNLLTKAIPYDDSLPDPANIRDWTARDLDRLPADQQKEWREAQFEELEALKK